MGVKRRLRTQTTQNKFDPFNDMLNTERGNLKKAFSHGLVL